MILATPPVLIHIFQVETENLYRWEVGPAGHGTAPLFEDAFHQALTSTLTALQEQIPQEAKPAQTEPAKYQSRPLDELLLVPFDEVNPAQSATRYHLILQL